MSKPVALDYGALFEKGIRRIEALSSDIWTDYNAHDPGITILEYLCYALTDLSARADLPMTTLLAEGSGDRASLPAHLPRAQEILPCRPLTLNDYRRLFIDLPGVRNAWLRPLRGDHAAIYVDDDGVEPKLTFEPDERRIELEGFYRIDVEFDKTLPDSEKAGVLDTVRERFMAHRNLCEDLAELGPVGEEEIAVCADLELTKEADVDEAMAEVLYALDEFISPTLRFYTLKEMMARGRSMEEIYRGPLLDSGFLDEPDLDATAGRDELHSSDVVQRLMDIPQIVAVKRLLFTTRIDDKIQVADAGGVVPLTPGRALRFDTARSRILFFKEQVPYIGAEANVAHHLTRIRERQYQPPIGPADLRPPDPVVRYVDLDRYTSIQRHFPLNYGIGMEGLPESASAERKAAAKQLKAYLLLFEQFLADYLAQLDRAGDLLSPRSLERSRFTQLPTDVPEFDTLIADQEAISDYHETPSGFEARRNRFLDHLLARFGEQYREYGVLADAVYGAGAARHLIRDKERIHDNIVRLNRDRAAARNYTRPGDPFEMAGLERRIRILLGYPTDTSLSAAQLDHFEIYDEADADGVEELRFRLRDEAGAILISGTRHFHTRAECRAEMRQVAEFGTRAAHYRIMEASDGRFYFALFNDRADMIGWRTYFANRSDCEAARDRCLAFLQRLGSEDRLFVLEHLLLRPYRLEGEPEPTPYVEENDARYLMPICDDAPPCADPYSFRITVIMPAWPDRFREMRFRSYVERFIREQTPAHIYARICWVSESDMDRFENAYVIWKDRLARRREPDTMAAYLDALERLLTVWRGLRNVYPPVHVHSCEEKEAISPAILGHAALGTSNGEER